MHFNERRLEDPQGVIDDLLKQITAQAVAIHEKNKQLALPVEDGVQPLGEQAAAKKIKPRPKPKAVKKPTEDNLELPLED